MTERNGYRRKGLSGGNALRVALAMLAMCVCAVAAGRVQAASADELLGAAGVRGGLVVHLGCGDGRLTAALGSAERYLVHGLDMDAGAVASAAERLAAAGLSGRVVVERLAGGALPYVDGLVNLLIVGRACGVPGGEMARVLAPGGVLMVAAGVEGFGAPKGLVARPSGLKGWSKFVRPRPGDIDEWTHFLHDASGNAVAQDRQVGPPRGIRWWAGPKRTRDHDALASFTTMTTSAGRVFYIVDEGPTSITHRPPRWKLVARDAFSGVLLWKREIPTWVTHLFYFRSGPVQMTRRLVSVGERVYVTLGLDAPVSVLDAATGRTLAVLSGSEKTEEIIYHDGTVLTVLGDPELMNREAPKVYGYWELSVDRKPDVPKRIAAYDAAGGKLRWRLEGEELARLAPLSLSAAGGKVCFLDGENLRCVALADGRQLWKAPFPTEGLFLRNYAPTVVMHAPQGDASDGVVLCMTWKTLAAFSLADGRELWRQKGAIGFASPGDLFVIGETVWAIPMTASIWRGNRLDARGRITTGVPIPRENFLGEGGREIWGMDLRTGKVRRRFVKSDVLPGGHHHRCYRNKATTQYLVCGRRGVEYVDLEGDHHVNNWWIRGICQYGVMPANGLTYIPPDPCRCFNLVKFNGLCALTTGSAQEGARGSEPALWKGPAYAEARSAALEATLPPAPKAEPPKAWPAPIYPARRDEWPTLRGNITRSGSTPTPVPPKVKVLWRAEVGGGPTASTIAGGRVLVCSKDTQTVHCLDAKTGRALWHFLAPGRVDSPPTIGAGLCWFGCADGSVYCLRLADGRLAWRYRAAPAERRIVSDDRLESAWPVSGSVLVQGGRLYAAAGRSSYLDGGIRLLALDARTGEKLRETTISGRPVFRGGGPQAGASLAEPSVGALPDVLVSDGQTIHMRHLQFTPDLALQDRTRTSGLVASTGLLEDLWAHRQNWFLGAGPVGHGAPTAALPPSGGATFGKLICFDARLACSAKNPYTWLKRDRSLWPAGHEGHLHQKYARYSAGDFPVGSRISAARNGLAAGGATKQARRGRKRPPAATRATVAWSFDQPIQPRAMVLAGDVLFVAGWRDKVAVRERTGRPLDPANPDPRPALLRAVAAADGKTLAEMDLPAEPVFDALASAYGRLYLSLTDGSLLCLGPAGR